MNPLRHPAIALLYTIFIMALVTGCIRLDDGEPIPADGNDSGLDAGTEVVTLTCVKNLDCVDDDPCTVDRCVNGQCTYGQGRVVLEGENLGLPLRPEATGLTLAGDTLAVARGQDGYDIFSLAERPASLEASGPTRPEERLTCPCRGKGPGDECLKDDPECMAPSPDAPDAGVTLEITYTCQRPAATPGEDALACIREAEAAPYAGVTVGPGERVFARAGRTVQLLELDGSSTERIVYNARDEVTDIVFLDDKIAAVGVYARGVELVDFEGFESVAEERRQERRQSIIDTNGRALDLAVNGETLLVADGLVGLVAIDLTPDEEQTGVHPTIRTAGYTSRVVTAGELAITNEGGAGIGVYSVGEGDFARLSTLPVQETIEEVGLLYPLAFTSAADGIRVYDVIEPPLPRPWASVEINLKGACLPGTEGCVSQCDTDMECVIEGRDDAVQERCIRGRCSLDWNLMEPGSPIRHFAMDGNRMVALLENGQFVMNTVKDCVECRVDDDCPAGKCVANRCSDCVCNDDCAGDQYCERGECVGGCASNDDCGVGEVCNGGLCFDCATDDDCELGQFCINGRCGAAAEMTDAGVADLDAGSGETTLGTACELLPDAEAVDMPDAATDAGVDAAE